MVLSDSLTFPPFFNFDFFNSLLSLGGLYFAVMKGLNEKEALLVEDLKLITLLEKGDSFNEDIKQILKYVAEDLNALNIKGGPKISLGMENADFNQTIVLKIVIGDLQGLPEIFFTRGPTADDGVRFLFFIFFIFFPFSLSLK